MTETYLPRQLDQLLAHRMQYHPAMLIVGPRAAGKTTSAVRLCNTKIKLDLPAQATVMQADPDAAIGGLIEPILIDEWQLVPEVLGAIKRTVDVEPRPGRFIVTGSVRGDIDYPTWPGTGRLLRMTMYGLTVSEIQGKLKKTTLLDELAEGNVDTLVRNPSNPPDLRGYAELAALGGFPEPVLRLPEQERRPWLESYIDQLLTRDIAMVGRSPDLQLIRRFFEACALHTACVVTQSTLREAAGIAKATAEAYEKLLGNLLIYDLVPAWWSNRLKRLTRSPKRYFIDSSLALAALRVDVAGLMRDGILLGRILDTFVMSQFRALIPASNSVPRIFHLRQEDGRREVDLLVEYGGGRVFAFEIKATSAPRRSDVDHLFWLREQLGDRFVGGAVLHTGPRAFLFDSQVFATPIANLWE